MPPPPIPHRLLVIRNDKLGDVMLAFPSLVLLRQALPNTHITALVSAYTAPIARQCPCIDDILIDARLGGDINNAYALAAHLKARRFDAVIALFSRFDTALAGWLARIPVRIAPATKLAQIFYNHRLPQHRSRSKQPEYAYNLDLTRYYLARLGIEADGALSPPYLQFPNEEITKLRKKFLADHSVPADHQLIFIHPGSGGSAKNLSPAQFATLARELNSSTGFTIVLSVGPGEESLVQSLSRKLAAVPHVVYYSRQGLLDFARHLQFADLFISGSTGPLHLAGALNRRTAAFYPHRRSATALRWQTINAADRRLAFNPPAESSDDMSGMNIKVAAGQISRKFLKKSKD